MIRTQIKSAVVVLLAFAFTNHAQARTAKATVTEDSAPSVPSLPLSGRVFSDVYAPANNLDTSGYRQTSASLWLQGDPKLGDSGSARFILTGDAIENNTDSAVGASGSQLRAGLREGYVSYAKNGLEFRFGRQIIPWGKSDVVNPTDFLSAKDYTFFNPDEEVRRVGAMSLLVNWTPAKGNSPLTFTFVGTPVFAQAKLLVPPSAVPSGIALSGTTALPAQTVSNTETAFKVTYAASKWDASVSAFRGFNHMPEFAILSSTVNPANGQPTSFTVGQTFHRIRAAGADLSFTAAKMIFRAESSYTWTENDSGLNPLIQPSHWDSVVGFERPLGDDFRVQAQFVYRAFPLWAGATQATGPDPVTTQVYQGVAKANALLLSYQDANRPGATFRFSYSNEANGVDAELFLLGNFIGGDFLIRPKLSYHWTDALVTTVGVDWYGGPVDRPLGSMKDFNSVFAEAKYSF